MNIEEGTFTKQELHFMVKHESIDIKPNFISDKLKLISGEFGPFRAGVISEVPIWLALYLKKRGKCTILLSEDFSVQLLKAKIKEETESKGSLTKINHNFFEIFDVVAKAAKDDIEDFESVRSMVDDLKERRMAKISRRIQKMDLKTTKFEELEYGNYTEQELQMNKNLIGEMLEKVHKIKELQHEKKIESGDNFVSQF